MKYKSNSQVSLAATEELLAIAAALSNPQRLAILGVLMQGRRHVSQLARDVGMSRPLVHMHLKLLEKAGLVAGELELSPDGKALKCFEVKPFDIHLTPANLAVILQNRNLEEK